MTAALKGQTLPEATRLFELFHALVTQDTQHDTHELGKLAVFAGVRQFPMRVKCATLCWHTLRAALAGKEQPVTTE